MCLSFFREVVVSVHGLCHVSLIAGHYLYMYLSVTTGLSCAYLYLGLIAGTMLEKRHAEMYGVWSCNKGWEIERAGKN